MKNSRLLLPRRILQNALFPSTILKRVLFHEGTLLSWHVPLHRLSTWALVTEIYRPPTLYRGKAMRQAFAKLLRHSPGKSDSRVKAARWKEIKALVALFAPLPLSMLFLVTLIDMSKSIQHWLGGRGDAKVFHLSWWNKSENLWNFSRFLQLLVASTSSNSIFVWLIK